MKNLFKSFQRASILCIAFIAFHFQLFAQNESVAAYLGISKKSFINTCVQEKWKFTIDDKGSMNFDYQGGNWYVSFDENDVIDVINLTSLSKEQGDLMVQKLTSGAYLVDDNATVTRWRHGNQCLMYFKLFQPTNGSSIIISDNFFNITSTEVYASRF